MIYPVSFTLDHIETLYEMDVTYKEKALAGGFQSYLFSFYCIRLITLNPVQGFE